MTRPPFMHRANALLDRILSEDAASLTDLAETLMASPDSIIAYRAGREIPMERQMLLAAYAIERAPKFARQGHGLRGQIIATLRFAAGETARHDGPPAPSARSRWA